MTPATQQANFRLSDECRALLEALAEHYAKTLHLPKFAQSQVLEMIVREKAASLAVKPSRGKLR